MTENTQEIDRSDAVDLIRESAQGMDTDALADLLRYLGMQAVALDDAMIRIAAE